MIRKFLTTAPKFNAAKSVNQKIKYSFLNNQPPEFDAQKDYYRILELSKNASDSDVKKSYYKLAKQYHPDANKGYEAKFKDISEAYGVLSNDKIKQQYVSARTFKEGWSKMGSKAQQGSYSYEEYQNVFYNMSPE
jgi:molecular chaperone DnaJ